MSSGGEVEGPGSVGDVSVPHQIHRVDLNENQLLYFPEPVFRGNRVYHLHQRQCQVSHAFLSEFTNSRDYVTWLHKWNQFIMQLLKSDGWEKSLCLKAYVSPSIPSSSQTLTTSPFNNFHSDHSLPTPLLCPHFHLWDDRNSGQDPLTPISSPGGLLPPSLGQSSPSGPPVVLSPGQVATRWGQAIKGEQGLCLHGSLLPF